MLSNKSSKGYIHLIPTKVMWHNVCTLALRNAHLHCAMHIFWAHISAWACKDILPEKVLTRWIFSKLLDEERLPDLGTGKSSS